MAVTFTLDMPGMTREQLDGMVQQLGAGPGKVPDGQIAHIEAITDDGARVIDVWESVEAYERFMEERLGPIFAANGMPPFDMPQMLEVHRVFVAEVGPAAPA